MNEKNIKKPNKKMLWRILIPVLIVCAVGGIWLVKSLQKNSPGEETDFSLTATKVINLEKLKSYHIPILIEFGADGCEPCREMAPIIEALNRELQGKAIVKFADVWKYPGLAAGYPLQLIPTQLFIDANGNPYSPKDPAALEMELHTDSAGKHTFTTHVGVISKDALLAILKDMGMKE